MHSRRPLPALALVLPHPPLPHRASLSRLNDTLSPHTPRSCSPSTPALFSRQLIASPRTSTDSWGSSNGKAEDEIQWDWKPEQMSLLVRTLDVLPGHLFTPFNGPVPPSNLLDKLARSVTQAQGPLEWPHSVRATRAKLVEIARARDKGRSKENMTIDEQGENQVRVSSGPHSSGKRPIYRQSSMDFLPSKDKGSGSLSRLSSRLQRADRIITTYHPYPRPASRSPTPPLLTPRSGSPCDECVPRNTPFASSSTTKSPCSGPSTTYTAPRSLPRLRRSASSLSTHSNPVPTSSLSVPGMLAPIQPAAGLRRSDSFTRTAPKGPVLKRAPSFGSTASCLSKTGKEEKLPQDPESDEEEKEREKKVKRPRTRSTVTTAPENSEKKKREKKKQTQKEPGVGKPGGSSKSTTPSIKTKSRPKLTRSGSMFGAELPHPQPQRALPADVHSLSGSPAPGSPPKTLRRVKTTAFCLRPPARKISFETVPEEQDREREDTLAPALGSAFQLS